MKYKMVDLFAGCGGLSLGMEQAGFTPWFVNEIVETFCNTYKRNHTLSDGHYFVGDINELNEHLDEYEKYLEDFYRRSEKTGEAAFCAGYYYRVVRDTVAVCVV